MDKKYANKRKEGIAIAAIPPSSLWKQDHDNRLFAAYSNETSQNCTLCALKREAN